MLWPRKRVLSLYYASLIKRLFSVYLGEQRGKSAFDELEEVIKKDQRIFYEILKLKKKFPKSPLFENMNEDGIFDKVRDGLEGLRIYYTVETIALIYKKYKEAADIFTGESKIYSLKQASDGSLKKKFVRRNIGGGKFKDELAFLKYFMKTPLEVILKRSQELSLSLDFRCSRCKKRVVLKSERKSDD